MFDTADYRFQCVKLFNCFIVNVKSDHPILSCNYLWENIPTLILCPVGLMEWKSHYPYAVTVSPSSSTVFTVHHMQIGHCGVIWLPYGATVSHHHDPRGIKHQRYDHGKIITALEIASASCVIQFSEIIGDLLSRCQKATCDLSPGVASITNP